MGTIENHMDFPLNSKTLNDVFLVTSFSFIFVIDVAHQHELENGYSVLTGERHGGRKIHYL
jgi:hypothetical protein